MKKLLFLGVLGFVIILILMSMLIAQDNINDSSNTAITTPNDMLKNSVDAAKQDINTQLDAPLPLIPAWRGIFRVLFRLDGDISLRSLSILILLWISLFAFIFIILKDLSFFGNQFMAFLVSLIITSLASIGGAIDDATKLVFTFGFFIVFGIIIIVLFILTIILKIVKKKAVVGNAEISGQKAGAGAKVLGKALDELGGKDKDK